MHEMAICRSLLSQVGRVASEHPDTVVTRVVIAVGPLSGVETGQLARAFEIARLGTVARGAVLEIERIPVTIWCDACERTSRVAENRLLCGGCGGWRVTVRSGDELMLKRLSLADAPQAAIRAGLTG